MFVPPFSIFLYSEFDCYSPVALFHGLNIPLTILFVNTFFKSFLYFTLNILKPTIYKRFAFDILQNRRVPDCAVSVVCQLIRYRIIGNAVVFDGYCFAYCMRLASLKKIISIHKITFLTADCLFPLVPAFFPVSERNREQRKALIYQGFLDFVKGLFPLFPLFLKFLHERKHIHFITLN